MALGEVTSVERRLLLWLPVISVDRRVVALSVDDEEVTLADEESEVSLLLNEPSEG